MVYVSIQVGKGYVAGLERRMKQYRIGKGELARMMRPPLDRSQLSRYFTKRDDRRVVPTMAMVERIEEAMRRLTHLRDHL